MRSEPCPCGNDKTYATCCKPFVTGKKKAKSPEELMRARYSSYVKSELNFTEHSMHPDVRDTFEKDKAEEWSNKSEWVKLDIIESKELDETTGTVEFKAYYKFENEEVEHHELSTFKKEGKEWFFYDGKIINAPLKNEEPKIGRNEPCPCGSGKKFKKCCG